MGADFCTDHGHLYDVRGNQHCKNALCVSAKELDTDLSPVRFAVIRFPGLIDLSGGDQGLNRIRSVVCHFDQKLQASIFSEHTDTG